MRFGNFSEVLSSFRRFVQSGSFACGMALAIFSQGLSGVAVGQSGLVNPFKRGGRDTQEVATLKPENGPWMIFAYSFEGEKASEQAAALAKEIQRDLGLPSFVMEKKFDYSSKVLGSGFREDGTQKVMKYRDSRVVSGYAVMAGEFDSIDHPSVPQVLEKIKTYQSKSLSAEAGGSTDKSKADEADNVRSAKKWLSSFSKEKPKGPLENAFMTRNPLLPIDFFQSPDLEKFVYDMNRQPGYNEYSLLDCKHKYTVRVLTFQGESEFVSWGKSSSAAEGRAAESTALEQAAERAYIAMKALREAGYEAYQFHDREQSIVTVGGFDQLGTTDANNRFVYSEGIRAVIERFSSDGQLADTSKYDLNLGKAVQPRLLLDLVDQRKIPELYKGSRQEQLAYYSKLSVGFDLKPTPMAIPRYSASRIYAGSRLGGK